MKIATIIQFVLLLSITKVNAQITFVKKYEIPLALSGGVSIVEDVSGGYLFNGNSYDLLANMTYSYLTKCDPLGNVSWVKYFDPLIYNTSIKRFSNGDLLCGGGQSIMRLDNSGNTIWAKQILGISVLPEDGIIITSDDGIAISSYLQNQGNYSLRIIKLDSSGNVIWSKETPVNSNSLNSNKIIETDDGGLLTVFDEYLPNLNSQIFIIRMDSIGNMTWSKSFGFTDGDHVSDVLQSIDGNFLFIGNTNSVTSSFKIDSTGSLMWSKAYGANSIGFEKVLQNANGNLIIAGSIADTLYNDFLVMETNANGDILNPYSYSAVFSGTLNDIFPTNDLGYIAICNDGILSPADPNSSINTIELIKMDSLLETACNFQPINIAVANQSLNPHLGTYLVPGSITSNSIVVNQYPYQMNTVMVCKSIDVNELLIDNLIDLYPNPSTNNLNIEFNFGLIQRIEITDLSGKLVKTLSCNNSKLEIDISNLSSGIYFLNGISDQRVFRKKFVKN